MTNLGSSEQTLQQPVRLAMITSQAFSLVNFRGVLIQEMVRRGIQVYGFAPDYNAQSRQAVLEIGAIPVDYSLARTGLNPFRDIFDLIELIQLIRRLKIDISFCYFIKPVIYGTLAAFLAGVKRRYVMIEGAGYVYTESDEPLSLKRRLLKTLVSGLYRLSLSRAHLVYLLNADDEKLFVETNMTTADKVRRINGIGLDLDHYQNISPVIDPPSFILVARLLREKGIVEFVQAARIIKTNHPNARFYLVGDVDLNPGSISKEEVLGWVGEGLLEWPGHVADVRTWLAKASVFVLPSYYREGLPRSTQEAMACGRAIITTDAPGCRETVRHGLNGLLVPVKDAEALAQAMLCFIEKPSMIIEMGLKSRQIALENYDVNQINATILDAAGL